MIKSTLIINRDYTSRIPKPWKLALIYLGAIGAAEVLMSLGSASVGLILDGILLLALLFQASNATKRRENRFLVVLVLIPLMRLFSLMLPLNNFAPIYWYALVGIPLFISVYICARSTGLEGRMIGLHLTWRAIPVQLLIGLSGILLGYIEYLILRPEPLITELRWEQIWLPALILLIFTGLLEEIIFRGMLQTSATQNLGRVGILYAAVLFALLHIGYHSLVDCFFVFAVALLYGFFRQRTGSLAGISLSHGLTNIFLYLVLPILIASPTITGSSPVSTSPVEGSSPGSVFQQEASSLQSISPALLPSPTGLKDQVSLPATGSEEHNLELQSKKEPLAVIPQPTRCLLPHGWVSYTVQQGDTIFGISQRCGIDVRRLKEANCLGEANLIVVGQQLYVPAMVMPILTSTPQETPRPSGKRPPTQSEPTSVTTFTPTLRSSPTHTITPFYSETPHPAPTLAPVTGIPNGGSTFTPTNTPEPGR